MGVENYSKHTQRHNSIFLDVACVMGDVPRTPEPKKKDCQVIFKKYRSPGAGFDLPTDWHEYCSHEHRRTDGGWLGKIFMSACLGRQMDKHRCQTAHHRCNPYLFVSALMQTLGPWSTISPPLGVTPEDDYQVKFLERCAERYPDLHDGVRKKKKWSMC